MFFAVFSYIPRLPVFFFFNAICFFVPFLFFSLSLSLCPTGGPSFWPRQFTPAPGKGKERGVPHASLHPPGLSVPAEGNDWGQPWKEAHGMRLLTLVQTSDAACIYTCFQSPALNWDCLSFCKIKYMFNGTLAFGTNNFCLDSLLDDPSCLSYYPFLLDLHSSWYLCVAQLHFVCVLLAHSLQYCTVRKMHRSGSC